MRRRRSTEPRQIKVKVIRRKDRPEFVLRWTDPLTGKGREESSGIPALPKKRRAAERVAADREDELQQEVERQMSTETTWDNFKLRYTQEHLSGLSKKTTAAWKTTAAHVAKHIKPVLIGDINASAISDMVGKLRKNGAQETSLACYLRTLRAALNWANKKGLLAAVPSISIPKRSRGLVSSMRSRPVTGEEFDRMILAAKKVRGPFKDDREWVKLLNGLWWSGLRISEAIGLSWDWSADFSIQFGAKFPMFKIMAEGEKGHQDRLLPVAPEFARILQKIPQSQRKGRVFKVGCTAEFAGRVISEIGEAAKIVVNARDKFASAHDLRRAFGTRWATKLMPVELKELMRHRSIETTMKYYVQLDVDRLGSKLHAGEKGDISGDKPAAAESEKEAGKSS